MQAEYHDNGFAIVKGVFSAVEVEALKEHVQRHVRQVIASAESGEVCYEDASTKSVRCVFRMNERSDYFLQMMADSRLVGVAEAVFGGTGVVQDGVHLIDKAPFTSYEFPYHQDNAYQFWDPPESVLVTLALDESTPESGAIICLKGSHKLGGLPHHPSGVSGASLGLVDAPDIERYPEVSLSMQPGDIALHHANVIHRTGSNQTSQHRRHLGFAYHSRLARRDDKANARYLQHLKCINDVF